MNCQYVQLALSKPLHAAVLHLCLPYISISVDDLSGQFTTWIVIIATMHMDLVATGNIDIGACSLITQQARHALSQ